jgi:hypothetical protein
MTNTITVKVHNLLHNKEDFNKNKIESYINSQTSDRVKNVRIAQGSSNSPLFLEIESGSNNFNNLKSICRESVSLFSDKVDGVDVENSIRDKNLKIYE